METNRKKGKNGLILGIVLLLVFALWTVMIQIVDVQPAGCYEPQKNVGFAGINTWFHGLTGFSESLYKITDWLGLVAIAVCGCFGAKYPDWMWWSWTMPCSIEV